MVVARSLATGKASEEDPEDRRVYVYDMRCLGTARAVEDES